MIILMRGLPGSGKSTITKEIIKKFPNFYVASADYFFIDANGQYKFDPKLIKDAHIWCKKSVYEALKNKNFVIVDNTNTTEWEMEPYLRMANEFDIVLYTYIVPEFDVDVCYNRNSHGVPKDTIEKMLKRFEFDLGDDYEDISNLEDLYRIIQENIDEQVS